MTRTLLVLAIASLLLAAASAAATPPSDATAGDRWALAYGVYDKADPVGDAHGAVVCLLGDVNADGAQDVLLRLKEKGKTTLRALSGADNVVLWESVHEFDAVLQCAPDVAGDGIADPLVAIQDVATSALPQGGAPVSAQEVPAKLEALDGLTGDALLSLDATEKVTGGDANAVSGGTRKEVSLDPAGEGLYLFVTAETTSATTQLLDELSLSSEDTSLEIEIIDASGTVKGVIKTPAGSDVLAHAIIVDSEDATVLVLTAAQGSPVEQAPAQIPTVSAYSADGTLQWSVDLDATTQDVMLIPNAGDVNADGVQDLIVQTVPGDLGLPAASDLSVLSGADGTVLLERAADSGLLAGLPLGDVTPELPHDADALLLVTQATEDAPVHLECICGDDHSWIADLPAGATPVNGALDGYTGDLEGFHDLTGDGVPDVATLVDGADGGTLALIDGVDGSTVWEAAIAAGSRIVPVEVGDATDLAVLGPLDGSSGEMELALVDGVDGSIVWTLVATVPAELEDPHSHLEAVRSGDVSALILNIGDEYAYVIDAATGGTLWSGTALPGGEDPADLVLETSSSESSRGSVPGPGLALSVAAAACAALLARRRRG